MPPSVGKATPGAHASTHATAGSDAITPSAIGAAASGAPASAVTAHESASDPHTGYVKHSLATAVSDFLVASGAGAWVKKTLAEVKTILGLGSAAYTASTDYATAAKGVTNGDSHDHSGGDGGSLDAFYEAAGAVSAHNGAASAHGFEIADILRLENHRHSGAGEWGDTSVLWDDVSGKPATYPPDAHTTGSHSDWPAAVSATEVGYLDGLDAALHGQITDAADYTDRTELYRRVYSGVACKKAAIALRFDDGVTADVATVYPLLTARDLVAGFGVTSSLIGQAGYLSAANLQTLQDHGMEIMCHSATHGTASAYTEAEFEAETITAAATIEAASGMWVQGIVAPGTWTGELLFDSAAKMATRKGRMLKSRFAMLHAQRVQYAPVPMVEPYGVQPIGVEENTLANLQTWVNTIISTGAQVVFRCHSALLGTGGYLSVADFTTWLDYLVTKTGVGLSVVTPTALAYTKPGIAEENLIYDGSFELSYAASAWIGWTVVGGSPTWATGGRTGTGCAKVKNDAPIKQFLPKGGHRSVRITAYAKAFDANTTARMRIRDTTTNRDIADTGFVAVTSAGWTKLEVTACPDSVGVGGGVTETWHPYLYGSSTTDWVLFDDVTVVRT